MQCREIKIWATSILSRIKNHKCTSFTYDYRDRLHIGLKTEIRFYVVSMMINALMDEFWIILIDVK